MIFHEIYGCYYRTVQRPYALPRRANSRKSVSLCFAGRTPSLKASLRLCPP